MAERPTTRAEADLRRIRRRIDALDRRIVALIDERAALALEIGKAKRSAGRRAIRDGEREKEVLLRVALAKKGPFPTADLLAVYRRLMAGMRRLEAADRRGDAEGGAGGGAGAGAGAGAGPAAGTEAGPGPADPADPGR